MSIQHPSSKGAASVEVSFYEQEFTLPFIWNHLNAPRLQMLNLLVEQDEGLFELKDVLILGAIETPPFIWNDCIEQAAYNMFIEASGKVHLLPKSGKRTEEFFQAVAEIYAMLSEIKDQIARLSIQDHQLDWIARHFIKKDKLGDHFYIFLIFIDFKRFLL